MPVGGSEFHMSIPILNLNIREVGIDESHQPSQRRTRAEHHDLLNLPSLQHQQHHVQLLLALFEHYSVGLVVQIEMALELADQPGRLFEHTARKHRSFWFLIVIGYDRYDVSFERGIFLQLLIRETTQQHNQTVRFHVQLQLSEFAV